MNQETEIRRLKLELQAANQALESFTDSVSHDLRAPLRHILGYVEILQMTAADQLNEASRGHLQTITQSAAQLGRMFEALVKYSRLSRAELRFAPVDLAELVKNVRRELRDQSKGREIEWQIGDLPTVQGDPDLLRQVIVNLLSNAVKFTRTRAKAKIEIGANRDGHETICFVHDNGVGFDQNYAGKLFGLYQRFHAANEFEGIGFGLANVRNIVTRHGGRTWAAGNLNRGATFYFSIPNPPAGPT